MPCPTLVGLDLNIILARKPEAVYRNSVHKHIDKSKVYFASMGGGYVAGIPDVYYEGNAGCLWVEWKNFQVLPTKIKLTSPSSAAKLSVLQQQWLRRATKNGVNAWVICGTPNGGLLLPEALWGQELSPSELIYLTKKEIAAWITSQVHTDKPSDIVSSKRAHKRP